MMSIEKQVMENVKKIHYDETRHPFKKNCCFECCKEAIQETIKLKDEEHKRITDNYKIREHRLRKALDYYKNEHLKDKFLVLEQKVEDLNNNEGITFPNVLKAIKELK